MSGPVVKEPETLSATKQKPNDQNSTRHARKCAICNHPDRAAIEFDFLNWRNPGDIVRAYRFRGLSTIYRHAHATGLLTKRRLNLRFAMERIVERVNEVPVTANAVIRAARAITRINDEGQWVDPPSHMIVTHLHSEDAAFVGAGLACPDAGRALPAPACPEERMEPSPRASDAVSGHGFSRADKSMAKGGFLSRAPRASRLGRDTSARDASATTARPSLIFDDVLLDEPSDSASCEPPRINGKPPDPEIVLEIAPSLYGAVQARREAANVRLAPWSNPELERLATAAYCSGRSAAGGAGTVSPKSGGGRATEEQSAAPSRPGGLTLSAVEGPLPEATVQNSAQFASRSSDRDAPSALPHHIAPENNVADKKENVAAPSSLLPPARLDELARRGGEAAFDSSATACPEQCQGVEDPEQCRGVEDPEQGRGAQQAPPLPAPTQPSQRRPGPPLGSSGSANPPFPFDPGPLRRWKPRSRF